ncbi:tail fiber protein [Neotamlana laminarinivorans]|uniref:Tail fiber protein n=1 Tax=Neotamlana laminarinivorans TaxID=2883124 RepID=A0A9X1L232_9FLAO|nr:tail fiber protein [Tamlana laminarinivorans]MCB4797234.1 tail fiber protein [Tamlana laminarinivorans]
MRKFVWLYLILLGNNVFSQDISASAFCSGGNVERWVQLSEELAGTDFLGGSERIELEISGGSYQMYGKAVYLISSRDGLKISAHQVNGELSSHHEVKIYDNGAASNSQDKYIIGIKIPSGWRNICIRARALKKQEWLNVIETTEPSLADVTPEINWSYKSSYSNGFIVEGNNTPINLRPSAPNDWQYHSIYSHLSGGMAIQPKWKTGSENLLLMPSGTGNLGIGTTTPDAKLTVSGKIHAQEVKVTIDAGADFVFGNNYILPKLEDVEKFVKTNKHLPGIQSEKEMQENGLLLAEMNIKLLQKIEELTLYIIKQQKEIDNLKFELQQIKDQSK